MLTPNKPRTRRILFAFRVGLILFGFYFVYHAFHGNHGLIAYAQVQERVARLSLERDVLQARMSALQGRVDALHGPLLDGDLVDERARYMLGLIGQSERIARF